MEDLLNDMHHLNFERTQLAVQLNEAERNHDRPRVLRLVTELSQVIEDELRINEEYERRRDEERLRELNEDSETEADSEMDLDEDPSTEEDWDDWDL